MRAALPLAAWASLLAGLAHGGLAPAHFEEWWGYGLFFAAAAAAQALYGLALLTDALPTPRGRRVVLLAGTAGNALVMLLYVWTRTAGVPLFGPEAGEVEAVGGIDAVVLLLEAVAVAGGAWRLSGRRRAEEQGWAPAAR